jgi:hypothetical protein
MTDATGGFIEHEMNVTAFPKSMLERAPRATPKTWAQNVREIYAKATAIDWEPFLEMLESTWVESAEQGSRRVFFSMKELPKGGTLKLLSEALRKKHKGMIFNAYHSEEDDRATVEWINE